MTVKSVRRYWMQLPAGYNRRGWPWLGGQLILSTHNNCCFLVDGFDSDPMLMMPYNPQLLSGHNGRQMAGKKQKMPMPMICPLDHPLPDSFERGYKIAQKAGITFRTIHTKGEAFEQDCRHIYELFTTAFAHNWSSSARTEEEFMVEAQELQPLVDTDIFVIAEDPKEGIR